MAEAWKPIEGFENYIVSNLGNVKNNRGVLIKPREGTNGYKTICLYTCGKRSSKSIHRLVAETFLQPVRGKKYVDHINRDKDNNKLKNLRFVNVSENNFNRTFN